MIGRKVLLLLGFFLLIRTGLFYLHPVQNRSNSEVSGVLETAPKIGPRSQKFSVAGQEIVTERYPEYEYGDRLEVRGKTDKLGVMVFPKIKVLEKRQGNWFLDQIYNFRIKLVQVFQKVLPEPEAGLAAGILLGYKAGLTPDLVLNLRRAGLTHVVAASGTNLTFVAALVLAVGGWVLDRRRAGLLAIPLIWGYAILAGFEAAVIRAAIMVSFSFLAAYLGRGSNGFWGLGVAAYLMIFINPRVLFDLGFQLSVAAMIGVLMAGKNAILQVVAAQIMTAPIILANFGMINLLSFIVNVAVLWTIPIVMGFAATAGITGLFSIKLAWIAALPIYFLLHYFTRVTILFGSLDMGILSVGQISPVVSAGIYLVLAGIGSFIWLKK